jgi:hypothetical protein
MTHPELEEPGTDDLRPVAVDHYLEHLKTRLWPRPADSGDPDLLDELRDHLLCHVEQQVANGAPPASAAASALAEFGPLEGMAGALRGELVRPHLRRLNLVLLALGVAAGATWAGVLLAGPAEPWTEHTEPFPVVLFDAGGAFAGTSTLLAAVLSVLLIGYTGRLWAHPRLRAGLQRWSLRACWATLALGLLTAAQLAGYLLVRAVVAPSSLHWPAVITAAVLTVAAASVLFRPLRTVASMRAGTAAPRPALTGRRPGN